MRRTALLRAQGDAALRAPTSSPFAMYGSSSRLPRALAMYGRYRSLIANYYKAVAEKYDVAKHRHAARAVALFARGKGVREDDVAARAGTDGRTSKSASERIKRHPTI